MEPQLASLTLFQPSAAPVRLSLPGPLITLGRSTDCSVPIRDRFLSRHHAELVMENGTWFLRDCGSANGTNLNGKRIRETAPLVPGDRIGLGDSEIVFEAERPELIAVETSSQESKLSMLFHRAVAEDATKRPERLQTLNALALELLEDRPMAELFDFILERIARLLQPSRTAIALLADDRKSFLSMKVRRQEANDEQPLTISRTLLTEVVDERRVVSFTAGEEGNSRFENAESILVQQIRSAICAPLLVGDAVLGVLYADFVLTRPKIVEEDLRFFAQIARFAAMKVETTRLREEAIAKHLLDEELKTAYLIQSKLLPSAPPKIDGYSFAGMNKPCKTVSGDYYDFVLRPDGRIYFVVADVSGKGITAALIMSSVATGFSIFTRSDPTPSQLLRSLNETLAPKLSPSKFVTLLAGVLDPKSGVVEFANAGHTPPLLRRGNDVLELASTDMVIGLFAQAAYRDQRIELGSGDALITFTDGVIEAENAEEEQFGSARAKETLAAAPRLCRDIVEHVQQTIVRFAAGVPLGDDVTIVAITRD